MGRRQDASRAKRRAQNRTRFLQHIQQDGRPGLLSNTRAVPNEAEKGEIEFQAMLREQVRRLTVRKGLMGESRIVCIYSVCLLSSY